MEKKERSKLGKKTRAQGKVFEIKVRNDLISKGWIVSRWDNNVEFEDLSILSADEGHPLNHDDLVNIFLNPTLKKGKFIAGNRLYNCSTNFSPTEIRGRCVPAKAKFNPFTKSVMNMSSGFPDFIAYRDLFEEMSDWILSYAKYSLGQLPPQLEICKEVVFIESKMTGKLDKEEIEKAKWYLENNYCSKFLIAKKVKKGRKVEVEYLDLNETYK
jgi:hypothetical protein